MRSFILQLKGKLERQLVNVPKNDRWLINVVNIVFIILLAMALAQLTWRIFSPDSYKNASSPAPAQSAASKIESAARLSTISHLHLFGKMDVAEKVDAPIVAPETRLQLKLKGVFAANEPEQAFAIISDSKNNDKSYRVGSKVVGGAVLHAVYPDRVILKRNGRLETLRMSTQYDKQAIKTSTRTASSKPRATRKVMRAPPKLRQLKETLLKDPQKIWQQVRISPVLKNGSIKGYSVEHKDKQLMNSLNLQKGDVITEVNGKLLSDPSSLYGLMNQLKTQKSLSVTIERNNQEQVIQLQM